MPVNYTKDALEKLYSSATDEDAKAKRKRQLMDEIRRASSSGRISALRDIQKRGLGTSGASALAGTRRREAGDVAAAEAGKAFELAEQEKSSDRLGQVASLGMQQRGQEFGEEMASAQLGLQEKGVGLQEKQLEMQQANQEWEKGFREKEAKDTLELNMRQMDQAWNMFKGGQLHDEDMARLGQKFQEDLAKINNTLAISRQKYQNMFASAESAKDRAAAQDKLNQTIEAEKWIAQQEINASKRSWFEKLTGGIGAIGKVIGGVSSLSKKED